MPPAPLRSPSKRSLTALPESSRLTFLLAASQLLADSLPETSSHVGAQALKVTHVTGTLSTGFLHHETVASDLAPFEHAVG